VYQFCTDLDAPKRMDAKPFLGRLCERVEEVPRRVRRKQDRDPHPIDEVEDIYQHAEHLRATVTRYLVRTTSVLESPAPVVTA